MSTNPELFELSMSKKTQPLMDLVKKHCEENIKPIQQEYSALQNEKEDRWIWHPRQIELMEGAKDKGIVEWVQVRPWCGQTVFTFPGVSESVCGEGPQSSCSAAR